LVGDSSVVLALIGLTFEVVPLCTGRVEKGWSSTRILSWTWLCSRV